MSQVIKDTSMVMFINHKLENCILDYLVQSKVECSSFNVSNVLTTMGLFLNVEETKECVDLCENSDVKIEVKKTRL